MVYFNYFIRLGIVVEPELTSKFRIMKRVGCSLKPSENKKKYNFK